MSLTKTFLPTFRNSISNFSHHFHQEYNRTDYNTAEGKKRVNSRKKIHPTAKTSIPKKNFHDHKVGKLLPLESVSSRMGMRIWCGQFPIPSSQFVR
jgi:hypothetical protein